MASSRSLGVLSLDLVLKMGGFQQGMDQAARTTDKRMRQMEQRAKKFGTYLGTTIAAGATAAFAGLVALTKSAIDNADAMRDLSIRVGVSTEVLSAYGYAASQTGTDIDTLGKGLKILAKNAADSLNPTSEQAKVFDALGVKVTDASGKLKDLSELVPEVADKFKTLEDGTTKAALAQALFGKAGLELTEFLNQGSQGLDEFSQKAAALGIIIDTKTAAAADEFNDKLGDLKAEASAAGLILASELLPKLIEIVDWLGTATDANSNLNKAISLLSDEISSDIEGFSNLVNIIRDIGTWASSTTKGILELLKAAGALATFDFSGAAAHLQLSQENADTSFQSGKNALFGRKNSGTPISGSYLAPGLIPDFTKKTQFSLVNQIPFDPNASAGDSDLERRLGLALSNPTAKSAKGGRGNAGDAAKEAARQAEEARKALEEEVKAVTDAQDAFAAYAAQLAGPVADANYQYAQDQKRLNDLAKTGEISTEDLTKAQADLTKAHEKDLKAIEDRLHPANQMLEDLKFEASLLGKTREQQELLTAARYLGADAATAQGKAALAQMQLNQEASKSINEQIDAMDGLRDSAKTFLDDLYQGKGVWDSLKEAAGNFADVLFDIASRHLIEQIFGQAGTTGASASGSGFWSSILSIFSSFGGARASGGPVNSSQAYLVGEQGPELFVPSMAGAILPTRATATALGGAGGFTQNNTFLLPQRIDNRTQTQVSQRTGQAATEAIRRNGRS